MTDKSASLKLGDKTVDLSVKAGTIGPDVIDIAALYPGNLIASMLDHKATHLVRAMQQGGGAPGGPQGGPPKPPGS